MNSGATTVASGPAAHAQAANRSTPATVVDAVVGHGPLAAGQQHRDRGERGDGRRQRSTPRRRKSSPCGISSPTAPSTRRRPTSCALVRASWRGSSRLADALASRLLAVSRPCRARGLPDPAQNLPRHALEQVAVGPRSRRGRGTVPTNAPSLECFISSSEWGITAPTSLRTPRRSGELTSSGSNDARELVDDEQHAAAPAACARPSP